MELVERDSELAALTAAWTRARKGDGGFVVVTGESGGGKTAVVEQFAQGLAGQVPVLWGACDPLTTPRPMGPLLDVRNDLGEAARSTLEGSGQAHDIYTAVYDRLLEAPCVLVVEDLHWSDQGTIELLRFLLRRIGQTRSLVVGTIRTDDVPLADPRRAFMGDVARSPSAVTVELAPLSKEALREMLGDRASEAHQLYALTGGNPFFVTEMLTHQGPTIPVSVRDAILARTVDLGNSARDLLELLVCAAEAIPDRLLPDLGIDVDALRALSQAGLIQRSPTGVAFRHDICRQAIASTIPPGGEAALHQRLLTVLETAGTVEPAVLVQHAVAVGDRERVLTYATSAAREASRTGAHSQSAEFYALALRVGRPRDEGQRAELLECLAMEEYLIDQLDEAIAACAEAVELRTKQGDLVNLSRDHQALSIYKWYDADRAAADWHADMAVSVLADTHEPATVGLALTLQAYLAVQRSDLPGALALLEQASRCANESSDPMLVSRIAIVDGVLRVATGEEVARDEILQLVQGARPFDDNLSSGFSNLAYSDVEFRRLDEAWSVLDESLPLTVEWDLPICHVWQMGARGRLNLIGGDWGAAVLDAEAVLDIPRAPLARTWPSLVRGLVHLRAGDDVETDLDDAWDLAHRLGEPLRLLPAGAAILEREWLLGSADERLPAALAMLDDTSPGLAWARGDLAVWAQRVRPEIPVSHLEVSPVHRLQLEGEYAAAAQRWDQIGDKYEQALALVQAGGQAELRKGIELLDRLGADAVAGKLRKELREQGDVSVPVRRRQSTRSNGAGLTSRETEVLRLLDKGLSNAELASRLFISPKTAGHHVSSILAKLGVADRKQAARAGRELGLIS